MRGLTYYDADLKRASLNEGAGPWNLHVDWSKRPHVYLAVQLDKAKWLRAWARTWGPRPRVHAEIR